MLKDKFGFNFWPSFTDLMLSLVLVVLIILFVVSKMISAGSENLNKARESQQQIKTQIENQIGDKYKIAVISDRNASASSAAGSEINIKETKADIYLIDKLDRQTITFSDKVLFDSGESVLKPAGYEILNVVGPLIAKNLDNLSEIQIQGHADTVDTDDYNLQLAANRAMAVYKFLQTAVGINPAEYLMSATSFGKFKPVNRNPGEDFDAAKLKDANATEEMKAQNRRIEIVLFYKNDSRGA